MKTLVSILIAIGVTSFNGLGSTFEIVQGSFSWHEARADAEARGGRLAVLNTQERIDEANSFLNSIGSWPVLWLGLSDEANEGDWRWITGEAITAHNWSVDEPNGGGRESVAHIWHSDDPRAAQWNDLSPDGGGAIQGSTTGSYLLEIPASTLTDGLVAYYPFNGNANDESGNGHHGTMLAGGTFSLNRHGEINSALYLANDDFQTQLKDLEPYAPTTEKGMSVSFWATKDIRLPSTAILSQYPGGVSQNNFFFNISSHNDPDQWNIAGNGTNAFRGSAELSDGLWQHWVVQIFPGENGTKVYLNGKLERAGSLNLNANETNTPFLIGGLDGRNPQGALGSLDDVRIYNRALSEEEVSALYDLEKPEQSQSTFEIVEGSYTWHEAKADAEARGGRLAIIRNEQTWTNIATSFEENSLDRNLWLGGSEVTGQWEWLDGTPIVYERWDRPAPNNAGGSEDYLHIVSSASSNSGLSGYWNDHSSSPTLIFGGQMNGYLLEIPATTLTTGLVAYYPFNGNANDESGNENDFTIQGATLTEDRNGNASSAYAFDGVDAFMEAPNHASLQLTKFTFSAWIKPASVGQAIPILLKGRHPGENYGLWQGINLWGVQSYDNQDIIQGTLFSETPVIADAYTLVTATRDNGTMKLFINGKLEREMAMDSLPGTDQQPLALGYGAGTNYGKFHGILDDVRIYNRALSEEEVTALYDLRTTPPEPAPPGLEIAAYLESNPGEPLTVDATPISGYPTDFTYQWHLDGVAIPAAFGGTGSSIVLDGLLTFEGSWRVVVTNAEGSAEATFDYRVFVDTDGDGLSDGYEALISLTDPFDADTDQDGLIDSSELLELGTDPLLADTDGDGFDDYYELRNRFDPISPASTPESVATVFPIGDFQGIEFRFNTAKGVSYRVESSTDLTNWATEETGITGRGGPVYRFFLTENQPRAFFRAQRE